MNISKEIVSSSLCVDELELITNHFMPLSLAYLYASSRCLIDFIFLCFFLMVYLSINKQDCFTEECGGKTNGL